MILQNWRFLINLLNTVNQVLKVIIAFKSETYVEVLIEVLEEFIEVDDVFIDKMHDNFLEKVSFCAVTQVSDTKFK